MTPIGIFAKSMTCSECPLYDPMMLVSYSRQVCHGNNNGFFHSKRPQVINSAKFISSTFWLRITSLNSYLHLNF